MEYRLPELKDQLLLDEYVKETHAVGEKSITASDGFTKLAFEEWVNMIHHNFNHGNEKYGRSAVMLCFDEDKLIGLLSLRYEMPEDLLKIYGNVGYSVRPSKRRKGYATKILEDAKGLCKDFGLKEIILGALSTNVGSLKTIEKNGGIKFKESHEYKGELTYYYKIKL